MAYPIEVLTINADLVGSMIAACQSLNKVQSEFEFNPAPEDLRDKLFIYKRQEYKSVDVFQWLTQYKNEVKGHRLEQ